MRIEYNNINNLYNFSKLKAGDIFKRRNDVFMKVNQVKEYNAIKLNTMEYWTFGNMEVTKLDAKLVINQFVDTTKE